MSNLSQKAPVEIIEQNKIIFLLAAIATFSGLLIVFVFQFTAPMIDKNKQEVISKALSLVIPKSSIYKTYKFINNTLVASKNTKDDGITIYAGYTDKGQLIGIATETQAAGYQDVIKALYGYSPTCECITGIKILKTSETPGIGDKIYKDKDFVSNFEQLDASLNAIQNAIANPIITVKHGKKEHPWEIDSISGATISSRSIATMLRKSTTKLLPQLKPLLVNIQQIKIEHSEIEKVKQANSVTEKPYVK